MISIIGAGPIGCYTASLLASKYNVNVYEQKERSGIPVQCTGLLTSAIDDIVNIKKTVVNKINSIKLIAPNGRNLVVNLKRPNYVVDREKFDNYFFNKAIDSGVNFEFGARFRDYAKGNMTINRSEIKTSILIGADGPFSMVAKKTGIYGSRKFMTAMQYKVKTSVESDIVEVYLGYGCFGWIVPEEGNIARIGVIDYKSPGFYMNKLLKDKKYQILENQSGLVPIYNPKLKTQYKNVFLVGDAATQVKASTHGGLVPGLIAAKELSKSFRNYERNWKRKIGRELWLSLLIRKRLDRYNEEKYNRLIGLFEKDKIKEVIEQEERDFPSKIIMRLLLREPRLLKFI